MTGKVRIEVVVDAEGRVTATTHNTAGDQCLPYIQVLEQLLEATTVDSAYTPDFWRASTTTSTTSTVSTTTTAQQQ